MPKLTNQGETNVLNVYFKGASRGSLYLGLFTDTTEPPENATLATISELPVANGYARIALANGDWVLADDRITNVQKTFTASGGDWGNVYGYFICDAASGTAGNLLFVESFSDGPYNILNGLNLLVTPEILAA